VLQENELEFIMMLQEQSAFYTYFKTLDGVTADVVLELTAPPTTQPTTSAHFLASQQEEVILEEKSAFGFGAMIGLAVGCLWLCLTGCSVFYLLRARASMKEQHDLEDLLKQEKASSPLDTDSSDTSIPMGNDDVNSIATEAELSVLEKKKLGLDTAQAGIYEGVELSQPIAVEGDNEDELLATKVELNRSERNRTDRRSKGHMSKSLKHESGKSHSTSQHASSLRKSSRTDHFTGLRRSTTSKTEKRKATKTDASKSMLMKGTLSSSLTKSTSEKRGTVERKAFSKSMSNAKSSTGKSSTEKRNNL
jgi:hypothetical protein